jgi:hypothetical protein
MFRYNWSLTYFKYYFIFFIFYNFLFNNLGGSYECIMWSKQTRELLLWPRGHPNRWNYSTQNGVDLLYMVATMSKGGRLLTRFHVKKKRRALALDTTVYSTYDAYVTLSRRGGWRQVGASIVYFRAGPVRHVRFGQLINELARALLSGSTYTSIGASNLIDERGIWYTACDRWHLAVATAGDPHSTCVVLWLVRTFLPARICRG